MSVNDTHMNNSNNYVMASVQHKNKFSNKNYAVMGYLKFTKQKLTKVTDNTITVTKNGKKYNIKDTNNEFTVKISKHKVTISDNSGKKKSYSKKSLSKKFKKQRAKLNSIVVKQDANEQNNNGQASSQESTSTQQNNNAQSKQNGNSGDSATSGLSGQEKAKAAEMADPNIDPEFKRRINLSPDDPDYITPTHDPESWEQE